MVCRLKRALYGLLQFAYFFAILKEMPSKSHLADPELLVLLALIRLGPEAYGVSISREIEVRGRRVIALGNVYAALERLQARGLVKSEMGQATAERGGRAKRFYRITAKGLREVRATRASLIGLWQGVPALEGGWA